MISDPQYGLIKRETEGKKQDLDVTEEMCPKHTAYKTEFYCNTDKTVCCAYCWIDDHEHCERINLLDYNTDVLFGLAATDYLTELEDTIHCVDQLSSKIDENCRVIGDSRFSCSSEVEKFRKQLNDRLDELQRDAKRRLEEKHVLPKPTLLRVKEKADKKMMEIKNYQENELVGKMVIALLKSDDDLKSMENVIEKAKSTLNIHTYKFMPDRQLQSSLFEDVSTFGSFKESKEDPFTCLTKSEVKILNVAKKKKTTYLCDVKLNEIEAHF